MKYKFMKFLRENDVLIVVVLFILILFWVSVGIHRYNRDNTPVDSTSEKGIEAKTFEYKGHKYILFEKTNVFGPISVVHDPDCCK